MKNLIFISGPMGVGKTTISRALQKIMPNNVFLDGDWCWDMKPFVVSEERKKMVIENITFLLQNFINRGDYENIIFCWVMQEDEISRDILSQLDKNEVNVFEFALICSPEALKKRICRDIENSVREEDVLERALSYLGKYEKVNRVKLDVSDISPENAAKKIAEYIKGF